MPERHSTPDMPMIPLQFAQTPAPTATPTAADTSSTEAKLTGIAPATSTTGTPGTPATQTGTGGVFGGLGILPLIFVMVAVMMLMTTLSSRKDKKKRKALMDSLGKGDKVITIGGQIGFVDQVRDTEVVLRIDENSNAKARFSKASIQQVLESASKGDSDSDSGSNGTIEVKTKGDKILLGR